MAKRRSPYALEPQHQHAAAAPPTRRPKRSQVLALSPPAPSLNQPKTPLVLSDAERDVMDAVDAKLAALAGTQKVSPQRSTLGRSDKSVPETTPTQQVRERARAREREYEAVSGLTRWRSQMSIEALEQKKMLLPYLDKIEYINYQLQYDLRDAGGALTI